MIQISAPLLQAKDWKNQLATAIRDPAELLDILQLPVNLPRATSPKFPLRVPHSYVARMKKGDIHDPLFRQVYPVVEENCQIAEFNEDPVGDMAALTAPGVIHKYHGRVLLTLTGACAIHCRYCFRRHFPYQDANPTQANWDDTLAYLASHPEVHEVILSGGDPLSLSDSRLKILIEDLAKLENLRTIRFHTRLPIVIPDRITDEFLKCLQLPRLKFVIVLHANHANEIDQNLKNALLRLLQQNVLLLNQAVLLKNVNDSVTDLENLSHKLFHTGVLPYYLHQLDRVAGAAHFEVQETTALQIMAKLRSRLPGYLVPNYVRETAGEAAKIPLF